jgi:hypothetical protein
MRLEDLKIKQNLMESAYDLFYFIYGSEAENQLEFVQKTETKFPN